VCPSRQRLVPHDHLVLEPHDRLIFQADLVPVECNLEFMREVLLIDDIRVHRGHECNKTVLSSILGGVHRDVCLLSEELWFHALPGHDEADTGTDGKGASANQEPDSQRLDQALAESRGVGLTGDQHSELVATQTSHDVGRTTDAPHALRNFNEDRIP